MNESPSRVKAALAFSIAALLFAIVAFGVSGGGLSQISFLLNSVLVDTGDSLDLIEGANVTITATSSGTGVAYTISSTGAGGGATQNLFETITAPFGVPVTASNPTDTLTLRSSDSTITVSGDNSDNSIDFIVNQTLLNFYATIQDEGSSLTQRRFLNLTGTGVTCVDDAGNIRTNCDIPGGASSNSFETIDAEFGTNPVADSATDTLVIQSSDSSVIITGSAAADSLDFGVNQALLNFYATIQDEGSALTQRRILNLIGDLVECSDNIAGSKTNCTISSTGAGVEVPIIETVRKTVDEVVNNSSVLQNDDELLFLLPTNSVWGVKLVFAYDTGVTPAIKVAFSCPSGADFIIANTTDLTVHADCGNEIASGGAGVGDANIVETQFYGILDVASSGTLQLQWAQNTANASDTTVHAGSYFEFTRLDQTQTIGGVGGGDHAFTHASTSSDPVYIEREAMFFIAGTLDTTGAQPIIIEVRREVTFKDMVCNLRVAPFGGDVVVDLLRNGTGIFQGTEATIVSGETRGISGAPSPTTGGSGDLLRLDIESTNGPIVDAQDLTCQLRFRHEVDDAP